MIKVCGMTDAANIREIEALGVDFIGFIFHKPSPRYCGEVPAYLPSCRRVGVFVDSTLDYILEKDRRFAFDYIQLHGSESPEMCLQLTGFGISNKATFDAACEHASGGIIGSRFVTLLEENAGNANDAIRRLKADIGIAG